MVRCVLVFLVSVVFAASGRAQQGYDQFIADFQKSQQFKDDKLLDRSLRGHPREVLLLYYGLAREWQHGNAEASDRARGQMDLLLASWKRVFNSATLDKVERYYARTDAGTLKQLDLNQAALEQTQRDFQEARSANRRPDLERVRETAWKLADTFEKLGHALYAAESWELAAVAISVLPEITLQERRDAVFALERYKEQRTAWEFTEDTFYKGNMAWLKSTKDDLDFNERAAKEREAKGIKGDARGPEAVVDPKVPEVVADLTFEVMKADIEDCFIHGGAVMPNWQVVDIVGDTAKQLVYFQASQLFGARIAGKYYFSPVADAPATKGVPVTPANKPKPCQFWLDEKKTKPYAMWLFLGTDREPYMGLDQNLLADDKRVLVFYKSAASWRTQINGEDVVLYDTNADGRLMEPDPYKFGLQLPNIEVGKTTAVPAYDCMQIGKKSGVQPFSSYAKIGDKWFHLRPAKDGAAISARQVIPDFLETGTLQMKWTGPKTTLVQSFVVHGEGELGIAAFNLSSGRPVEVPAGTYAISFGRIAESKGGVWQTSHIFRGKSELITVKPGEAKSITIGAPFRFEFERETSGADISINTHKITVHGAAGEHYAHLNGCVPDIEVVFAKDDKGKGAKPVGALGPAVDLDTVAKLSTEFPDIGFFNPMFPIVKGAKERFNILRLQLPGDGVIGLRALKAKLFGKIESAWK